MTTQDIKNKINKVIEEVPESYLPDILSYLNQPYSTFDGKDL